MSETPMIERVRKLFAKAESTTSKPEADALLAKAYDLLAKYGISEAAARAGNDTDSSEIVEWKFEPKGKYQYDQGLLVGQVAEALHCTAVKNFDGRIFVYGARRHLDRVEMLTGMLIAYMVATAGKVKAPHAGISTVTYRKSVMLGFIVEVRDRLRAAEASAVKESGDEPGVGLVLLSDAKRAKEFLEKKYGRLREASSARRSSAGVQAGRAAASSVDLGGGNRVSGRRAISA